MEGGSVDEDGFGAMVFLFSKRSKGSKRSKSRMFHMFRIPSPFQSKTLTEAASIVDSIDVPL